MASRKRVAKGLRGHRARGRRPVVRHGRLTADDLRWKCPPLEPSRRPPRVAEVLHQPRPLRALRTGLEVRAPGYNVFVSGLTGTRRLQVLEELVRSLRPPRRVRPDRVYVTNFVEPSCPKLLSLPPGAGKAFRDELDELSWAVEDAVRAALGSRPHKMSRQLVQQSTQAREARFAEALQRQAARDGCAVVQLETQGGLLAADVYPVFEGEPVSPEALAVLVAERRLSREERQRLLARRTALLGRLEEVSARIWRMHRRTEQELRAMDRQVVERVLDYHFEDFGRRWPQAAAYLAAARVWILRQLDRWIADQEGSPPGDAGDGAVAAGSSYSPFAELVAHVVRTEPQEAQAAVVVENNPTFATLFGTIEPAKDGGPPGLEQILPGALLRADGGCLVLRVADVLAEPGVWKQLKRTLEMGRLEIRAFDPGSGTTTGGLQPEPIPLDVKVVMIGEPGSYEHLAAEDPQFLQTFKVHAEFDATLPASAANLRRCADFLVACAERGDLPRPSGEALAAMAEFAARRAGRRDRLLANLDELEDLLREAADHASAEHAETVSREHVRAALRVREQRMGLLREQVEREFRAGYLLLRDKGREVGVVNALTVLETPACAFGKPSRITAATGVGGRGEGLCNIEREASLSGPSYDKGVLILGGYLLERFGRDGRLCLRATLCLEQTYGGIDGDSASSAELYALISSLARVGLDQGLAVTGSVNQKGEIQAVSDVNEKIEGFFRFCRMRGLNGRQGVLIPVANVADLMLDEDVVAAVAEQRFHVHAIEHVDQGIELLTGLPAPNVEARVRETLARFRRLAGVDG